MVNIYNRRLAFKQAPKVRLMNGTVPYAPPNSLRSCVAPPTGSSSPGAFAPRPSLRCAYSAVTIFLDILCIVCELDTVAARRLGAIKCAIGPNDRFVNRLAQAVTRDASRERKVHVTVLACDPKHGDALT